MSKRVIIDEQLSINFSAGASTDANSRPKRITEENMKVVQFIDKQTQSMRDDALRRVKANRIFQVD